MLKQLQKAGEVPWQIAPTELGIDTLVQKFYLMGLYLKFIFHFYGFKYLMERSIFF